MERILTRNLVIITSFILIAWVSGCDNSGNPATICKNNPELCDDLHKDSWCRREKNSLIIQRYQVKTTSEPSGKQIYHLLVNLENYNRCVGLASGVQHILNPERTNDRARAYGLSAQSLSELQASTKGSNDIYIAFYHWAHLGDDAALKILLEAEQQQQIDSPEILAGLAGYYLKFDAIKAKQLYLKVFSKSTDKNFDSDWLLGLASASRQLQDMEQAYLLSRANLLLTDNPVDEAQLKAMIGNNSQLSTHLDEQASNLAEALKTGNYLESDWPKRLQGNAGKQVDTEAGAAQAANSKTTDSSKLEKSAEAAKQN
ncbi:MULTISPECIES: DUF2989 domain-containing protein [Shewanella]|uniref:DUF2989 domain-containing protein n=1 Tax=Shewanella TaxID=22 RepID=UPI0019A221DD|nr:DUF2989 domain-containing protein [Shewanella chilikensis]GGZ42580.1 hypothetical protein GCM10007105_31710 [Shewanella chilikensis]